VSTRRDFTNSRGGCAPPRGHKVGRRKSSRGIVHIVHLTAFLGGWGVTDYISGGTGVRVRERPQALFGSLPYSNTAVGQNLLCPSAPGPPRLVSLGVYVGPPAIAWVKAYHWICLSPLPGIQGPPT
jgi:hypothetical protein